MLRQLSPQAWFLEPDGQSDRPALGYVRGARRALAVDAGASRAHVEAFYAALTREGLPLPDLTVISHSHWDHSYAAPFVHGLTLASDRCAAALAREAAWSWTPQAMRDRLDRGEDIPFGYYCKLAEYPDPGAIRVAPPDLAVSGDLTADLGGVTARVLYCGGPHSPDHVIVHVPEEGLLFLGDAAGKALFELDWDYDPRHPERLPETLAALPWDPVRLAPFAALLESLPFDRCVLGHEAAPWTRAELLAHLAAGHTS